MGGELGLAASSLLGADSAYAAAALVRQIVKVEYLLYLSGQGPEGPERWLKVSDDELRKWFQPVPMRRRARAPSATPNTGRTRERRASHPRGARLLLQEHRDVVGEKDARFAAHRWLWMDTALHLGRVCDCFVAAATAHDLVDGTSWFATTCRASALCLARSASRRFAFRRRRCRPPRRSRAPVLESRTDAVEF
jgi:hypothetical protein